MSVLDAMQELLDNGVHEDEVRGWCDSVIVYDEDENRAAALLAWLLDEGHKVAPEDIGEGYDGNSFTAEGAEYLVLTEDEADEKAGDYIEETLWAFTPSWMACETGLPEEVFTALQDKCEDANDAVRKIVDSTVGIDEIVNRAVQADGRGHFIASYDGAEQEIELDGHYFLIYRVN
jgi:hypothetical protein